MDDLTELAHLAARLIETAGIAVILLGALFASLLFLRNALLHRDSFDTVYRAYRLQLGRSILLGLELLVAGDIINTVSIEPSFRSVGVLGLIVLVRTFLSFSLEVELQGRWPWQQGEVGSGAHRQ